MHCSSSSGLLRFWVWDKQRTGESQQRNWVQRSWVASCSLAWFLMCPFKDRMQANHIGLIKFCRENSLKEDLMADILLSQTMGYGNFNFRWRNTCLTLIVNQRNKSCNLSLEMERTLDLFPWRWLLNALLVKLIVMNMIWNQYMLKDLERNNDVRLIYSGLTQLQMMSPVH